MGDNVWGRLFLDGLVFSRQALVRCLGGHGCLVYEETADGKSNGAQSLGKKGEPRRQAGSRTASGGTKGWIRLRIISRLKSDRLDGRERQGWP